MTDIETKKLLEEQRKIFSEDTKGFIGVLVENFDSKIELIAEQHNSMMNKIETLNVQMVETNVRLGHIEDGLRRKVDYEDFEKLEKRVALLEAR